MDHLSKLIRQLSLYFYGLHILTIVITIGSFYSLTLYTNLSLETALGASAAASLCISILLARLAAKHAAQPIRFIWQAILHISPGQHGVAAPNVDKSKVGRELITNLILQIYQLASNANVHPAPQTAPLDSASANILHNLPVPLFALNKEQIVVESNQAAADYIGMALNEIRGKNFYSLFDILFSTDDTLDSWLSTVRSHAVTGSHSWDRVRLATPAGSAKKQFDMAAHYSQDGSDGIETVLTLFDKSKYYAGDDDGIGFIALAVHELRTPLTMLRGYIEVFEDELEGKLDPELDDFMQKMQASAQQLSYFVGNILNVARVEENQLFLQLHEENWEQVIAAVAEDMKLRAKVHKKNITYEIQPHLPTVAVDKVSIYEVMANLIDNAIKYSGATSDIHVKSYLRDDGFIETTVQDSGVGIPASVMSNLFEKFYRNHRSRAQVGGTGLGLYLSKAIVTAHGGQIWVKSKEEGGDTVFGFTLQAYKNLAETGDASHNKDITRTAHGWIKNHSFYKR